MSERIVTPFDHITEKVIGIAFLIHGELGGGFLEKVYENALCLELNEAGLRYERQKQLEVRYKGHLVGEFIADIVVEDVVLIELKAVREITPDHVAQCINYLNCTKIDVGQIFNFGKSLTFKRLLSNRLLPPRGLSVSSV